MVFLRRWCIHVYALLGYAVAAVVFTWPLTPHFSTHLTGPPGGDTGVYVWNQWVFRQELLDGDSPYFTDKIFSLSGANLSLHNYTAFQDLVALPLIGWLGVVPAFNLVYLLMTVLTGYAMFLLARYVVGSDQRSDSGSDPKDAASWMAGLLFAWSPMLVTRGGGHFSLVTAAPLAIFLLLLLRSAARPRVRDAVLLGVTLAWAAGSDVYYAVYCLIAAAVFLVAPVLTIRRRQTAPPPAARWSLDVLVVCAAALVLSMVVSGGWQFTVFGREMSMRSFYTPMLVLTLLVAVRLALIWGLHFVRFDRAALLRIVRLGAVASMTTALVLSPLLYALAERIAVKGWDPEPLFWRSSPGGIDLMTLMAPNPNHPWTPAAVRAWVDPRGSFENVASVTFTPLLVILLAWRTGWRLPQIWVVSAAVFLALALGPFVHVAGVNTYIPGPWAILRYLPVVGLARTPARFSVMLTLVVAVLFGWALCRLVQHSPSRRRLVLVGTAALLIFELLPAPRPLYSAAIPTIYRHVAAAPRDVRVLELPFGVRDGTMSAGDFTARSQFFQTAHGKRLIGGYLSRVSRHTLSKIRSDPMLDGLLWLSEGRALDPSRARILIEQGPAFIDALNIAFVVIDLARAPEPLRDFALQAYQLQLVEADSQLELYRPATRRNERLVALSR